VTAFSASALLVSVPSCFLTASTSSTLFMNIDGWIGNQLLNPLSEPAQYTCQRFPFFHRNRARLSIQNVVFVVRTPFFSRGYPIRVGIANSNRHRIRLSGKDSS